MNKQQSELLSSTLLVALSVAFLWHFSNIVRFGRMYIQEPNPVILYTEIILLLSIATWGIWRVVRFLRDIAEGK